MKTGIEVVVHREIKGKVKRIAITKTPAGNYYASLMCEHEIEVPERKDGKTVGIDVGLIDLLTTSYGLKIKNLRLLKKYER